MEGFGTVLLIAFAGLIFAPGKSNAQAALFDHECPGVKAVMEQCVADRGIEMSELMALQSDPAKLQEMKGKVERLCKSNELSRLMDCYIDAMKSKCSAETYRTLTTLMNLDGFKDMAKYMCDNLDEFMDERYRTCTVTATRKLQPCAQSRAPEIQQKMREVPYSERTLAAVCYGLDIAVDCMKPELITCPNEGKAMLKLMTLIKPKRCSENSLSGRWMVAAGMTNSPCDIPLVLLITAFSFFLML